MIKYKKNVLEELKERGYSTYKLGHDKILGQQMIQKIRSGGLPSWAALDIICRLLNCQPGDLIEYVEE